MRRRCGWLGACVLVLSWTGSGTAWGGAEPRSPIAFHTYPAPEGFPRAHQAGETSIGVNPRTNAAMFLMTLTTARVTWDDGVFPPRATWTDVTHPVTGAATNDPILWTDPTTGRTFVAQLVAPVGSLGAFTDDDGQTWTPVQPPHALPSWDHQTVGGGPYALLPRGANPIYPNAVYYCAQAGAPLSQCARSDDGGLSWGPPLPMNLALCSGLHGHVVVARDGSVWVPHKSCFAGAGKRAQGVMVSRTDGLTWELHVVPGTAAGLSDPVVAFDRGGRAYFVASSEGRALVATSADGGETWTEPVDVGAPFGVRNTEFPMAVAGDEGRAAVAFYGTVTPGNDQDKDFAGEWHLYAAFTFDGGRTWETVDVTPDDPVQRGCIWLQGGSNPCRNLLDFQGMTVDAEGRVLIGYADGCTARAGCNTPAGRPADSRDSLGTIARQTTGPRLFAAFDPPGPDPLRASAGGPYLGAVGQPVALEAVAGGGVPPYQYAWDLDGDGGFDDASGPAPAFVAPSGGVHAVAVEVQDALGARARAGAVVRVPDPSLERVAASWTFDGAGACDPQGWTVDAGPLSPPWRLRTFRPHSAPCAWYHGDEATGRYRPAQATDLRSPCLELPEATAAARFELAVAGELSAADVLAVEAAPCAGGPWRLLATVAGKQGSLEDPPSYATAAADLGALIGGGPFQLRLRVDTNLQPLKPQGYQLDSFRLVVQ